MLINGGTLPTAIHQFFDLQFKEIDIKVPPLINHQSSRVFLVNQFECVSKPFTVDIWQPVLVDRIPHSKPRPWVCETTSLFFVLLVPGFSTASYLKVHIKTHHGSPLPPSATMHTFPEPRGELQIHNGTPYHMGRQCSVEGKQPPSPSQIFMFLAFTCSAAFWKNMLLHLCVCLKTRAYISLCCQAFRLNIYTSVQFHLLVVFLLGNCSGLLLRFLWLFGKRRDLLICM